MTGKHNKTRQSRRKEGKKDHMVKRYERAYD